MATHKKEQKKISKSPPTNNLWLKGKRLYALVIFVFSFVLYFNTLFNDYNLDDELVTKSHQVTSKGWDVLKFNFAAFNSVELKDSSFTQKLKYFLPVVFRVPYYQDKSGYKYEYRPLVFASFALEHALFSKKTIVNGSETETDSAGVSHFINVLLYALLCTLLFWVLCRLFSNYSIIFPFIVALLFAAYPMHTEVVASIKNRDELLALIFGLLSLKLSITFIEKPKPGPLVLLLLFFIAGILSKPTTIIFALFIPLCLIVFTKASYRRVILLAVALIIPSVLYSRVYSAVQQVELSFILFIAVTGLYILKNKTAFWLQTKVWIKNVFAYFKNTNYNDYTTGQPFDFTIVIQPVSVLLILLGALIPAGISAFGISIHDPWLACVPLILSCALFLLINNELKVVFTTPLMLVALYAMVTYPFHTSMIEAGLIVFMASQIFSGQKPFQFIGTINYVIFSAVSVIFLHSFHFILIIAFIGLLNRKLLAITLIILAGSVLLLVKKSLALFNGSKETGLTIMFPIFYAFVFLLWKGKWKQAINSAAIILPLSLIVYFSWIHPAGNNNTYLTVKKAYYQINSIKAADPTPVQSVRPLNYPEYPLSNKAPFSLKLGTSMEVLGKYLRMTLIPYPMSFYYGYSYITPQNIFGFFPLFSLLLYLLLFGAAIYFLGKTPVLSFSILSYLISITVFSNLVTPIPGMIADRFLLIPSIGFCIGAVYIISKISKQDFEDGHLHLNALKQPLKISLAAVLIIYSGLTFSRNMQWKDSITLFRHDITVVENSAQAQNLLAVHLFMLSNQETDQALKKQLLQEAVPHFEKALAIYPDFLNPSYDLGRAYEALQLPDMAFAQYQKTVKIDTSFFMPYFNMATILHNKGQYEAAIPFYQKFLIKYPAQLEAYTNLSFAYFQLKDFEKSIATNRTAITATGNAFYPTVNIAKTYTVMGQTDSALFYFEQAHAMQPNDGGVSLNIAKLKEGRP